MMQAEGEMELGVWELKVWEWVSEGVREWFFNAETRRRRVRRDE